LKDRSVLPADALAVLIGDHAQAVAVMRAAGRVAEATGRRLRHTHLQLLAMCL
jgi:hypothetical protein